MGLYIYLQIFTSQQYAGERHKRQSRGYRFNLRRVRFKSSPGVAYLTFGDDVWLLGVESMDVATLIVRALVVGALCSVDGVDAGTNRLRGSLRV